MEKLSLDLNVFLDVVSVRSSTPPCARALARMHSDQRCPTLCSITRLHRGAAVIPSWLRTAWVAMGRRDSSVTVSGAPYVSWNQAPPIMTWEARSEGQVDGAKLENIFICPTSR